MINNLLGYETIVHDDTLNVNHAQMYIDDKKLDQNAIYSLYKSNHFINLPSSAKSFGFSSHTFWFGFEISTLTSHRHLIELQHNLTENATLYTFVNNKLVSKQIGGYNDIEQNKKIPIRFQLNFQEQKPTYLLKVQSVHPHYTSFIIGENEFLDHEDLDKYLIFTFLCGVTFSLLFYNLLLFFVTKEKLYLYYTVYILGAFSLIFFMQGYFSIFNSTFNYMTPLFITLSVHIEIIGLYLFTIHFLNIHDKKIKKRLTVLLIIVITSMLSIALSQTFQVLGVLSLYLYFFSLLYIGFRSYQKGFKPALFYLAATGLTLVTFILYMFMGQGFLLEYTFFNYNMPTFGIIWDMIILSLALAYRIKILKEAQIRSEEMLIAQSKQNSIGELLGSISHQWRTPIAKIGSIITNLKIKTLHHDLKEDDLLKQLDKSDIILKEISDTIDTFQNFFQRQTTNATFNLNELILNDIAFFKSGLENQNIKVILQLDEECKIQGDKNQFSHALMNIILNSKDIFIERNIDNRRISINTKKEQNNIVLVIEDTANGIDIIPIEKIFDPYVSQKKGGVGLGLFISKQLIVNGFGGSLEVQNTKSGAQFNIIIPFYDKKFEPKFQ